MENREAASLQALVDQTAAYIYVDSGKEFEEADARVAALDPAASDAFQAG